MRGTVSAAAAVLFLAASAYGEGFLVFEDDRVGFAAALELDPLATVVDSGGAFAPDPAAGTAFAAAVRTGSVLGSAWSYAAYDVDFSNAPPGTITPGVVGGDIAALSGVDVERPAAQAGAVGTGSWGLDGGAGGPTTRNALLVSFTSTPGGLGLGHFALDLIDFEASAQATEGQVRLYRSGVLVFSQAFAWNGSDGNDEVHFLGIVAVAGAGPLFDQVAVVVGDDGPGGGNGERWAADRITFGRALANPEPGTAALVALGVLVLGVWRCWWLRALRRSRRNVADTASTNGGSCDDVTKTSADPHPNAQVRGPAPRASSA